jgi:hypothetical protein
MKKRNTLLPPTLINFEGQPLEYSLHKCPKLLEGEVRSAFPFLPPDYHDHLLLIITFQPASCELIEFTDEAQEQKDSKLRIFFDWANTVRSLLTSEGHWVDFTDPASGFPVHSDRGANTFSDVSACEVCLPYRFEVVSGPAGGCRLISHPKWRLASYPATVFTNAPPDVALRVLNSFPVTSPPNYEQGGCADLDEKEDAHS